MENNPVKLKQKKEIEMKKRIIVLISTPALVGILAASSAAMASKPVTTPVDQWQILIAKVNDIWDILTGADGLTSITSKLDDVDDKLDAIASTASNVVMESGSGSLELEDSGGGFWGGWQVSGPYPEVRHISLTLYNPNEPDLWVWIRTHFETEDGEKVALIRYF